MRSESLKSAHVASRTLGAPCEVNLDIPNLSSASMMVVKDRVGRKRYILFAVNSQRDLSRGALIGIINRAVSEHIKKSGTILHPWLTIYNGKWGIIRCPHTEKTELISLLASIGNTERSSKRAFIATVKTSGSIKKLSDMVKEFESRDSKNGS